MKLYLKWNILTIFFNYVIILYILVFRIDIKISSTPKETSWFGPLHLTIFINTTSIKACLSPKSSFQEHLYTKSLKFKIVSHWSKWRFTVTILIINKIVYLFDTYEWLRITNLFVVLPKQSWNDDLEKEWFGLWDLYKKKSLHEKIWNGKGWDASIIINFYLNEIV